MTRRPQFDLFVYGGEVALAELAAEEVARQWHEVSGGPLGDRRVLVRLSRDDHGTAICTGLLVGLDGQEITATNLRTVPLTAIVRQMADYLSEVDPADATARMLQDLLGAALAPAPSRSPDQRRRGGEGPTDQNLRDFMSHLERAGGRHKRGAKATAARTYGVDRTTAYRWLAMADQRGITGQEGDR